MAENMPVRVEVWPLAADDLGIWLLSGGDAWRSGPVQSDNEPHAEVEVLIADQLGPEVSADLLHSTSWRTDGQFVVLTYVACFTLPNGTAVPNAWPGAQPVSPAMAEMVGRPMTHGPAEPPTPRYIDVLMHAIRHLRYLSGTDETAHMALGPAWRRHLAAWEPALSGMYAQPHVA